ncbi:response regulator with CheY-like receiver domain and winged-helix DNA-binding domain [Caulobacter sp. AP07]|uniref:response regulator n=1 Tax=Caulobacter sp. AP07 TaxID=1144304 RepID=UPI00027210D0|nr:response regulator [Caulobacter sp. AP07]EJL36891.1 response regulator with CheY-like receiver domain and winged-helix DNA-binding domain [Caulobacter sp. AP07]
MPSSKPPSAPVGPPSDTPPPPVAAAKQAVAVAGPRTAPAAGSRVLVADDNAASRELVRALLRSVGHRVDLAINGAEAVAAASGGGYDLVLMDVRMPVQDGISATRAIRALDGPAARVPIIALSANILARQIETYRASGMDDHIGKPIATGELLAKVARWSGLARP